MASGAVLAGAYPSRYGISGMATLSMASFVTVAAIFSGEIMCNVLHRWNCIHRSEITGSVSTVQLSQISCHACDVKLA
jgi:hypothetical protein